MKHLIIIMEWLEILQPIHTMEQYVIIKIYIYKGIEHGDMLSGY